jgi:hypothetical protein
MEVVEKPAENFCMKKNSCVKQWPRSNNDQPGRSLKKSGLSSDNQGLLREKHWTITTTKKI